MEAIVIIALITVGILLVTQRWFWMLTFGLGSVAAWFTCLASIFHFQILAAMGFAFLGAVLWAFFVGIAADA